MHFFDKDTIKKTNLEHLIIGGGYVAEFHIRASLSNNFKIFLIEPDQLKRQYLKNIFPEINSFADIQEFIKAKSLKNIKLLSILIPPKIRKIVYENLPDINCINLIEKPLTKNCIERFDPKKTFLCLNLSYSESGKIIKNKLSKFLKIKKIQTFRPSPGKLLRQASIEEYLLYFLPHTLTPLNIVFNDQNPMINFRYIENKSKINGIFHSNISDISFSLSISEQAPDTIIKYKNEYLSFDNALILINGRFTFLKKILARILSTLRSTNGYGTMHFLYKDIRKYIEYGVSTDILSSLKITNTNYLALK